MTSIRRAVSVLSLSESSAASEYRSPSTASRRALRSRPRRELPVISTAARSRSPPSRARWIRSSRRTASSRSGSSRRVSDSSVASRARGSRRPAERAERAFSSRGRSSSSSADVISQGSGGARRTPSRYPSPRPPPCSPPVPCTLYPSPRPPPWSVGGPRGCTSSRILPRCVL